MIKQLLTSPTSMKQSSYKNLIRTYKRLKNIRKITGFSLIGKKKNTDISKNLQFSGIFFHKLDENKLLYKCTKFQVNSFCGLDFS